MSISEMLGSKGIFISDDARTELNVKLSEDEFQRLKETIKTEYDPDEYKKCFLTSKMVKVKDGLMLSPTWMADALQKVLDSKDLLSEKFKKEKIVICGECGNSIKITDKIVTCDKCQHKTNVKVYGKSIKLSFSKKLSFKLYIKFLRGKSSV